MAHAARPPRRKIPRIIVPPPRLPRIHKPNKVSAFILAPAGVCRENLHGKTRWRSCGNARITPSSRSRLSGRWPCRPAYRRSRDRPPLGGWVWTSFPGARLCPAPRGISRSTSECRAALNYFHAPFFAKLLRLVSATQPRSGCVPRLAAFACLRLNVCRESAYKIPPSRAAAQPPRTRIGRWQATLVFAPETQGCQARFSWLE